MALTIQDVCDLFERYGWHYRQMSDTTILTNFQAASRVFTVGARISEDWLTLTIVLEVPEIPAARQAELYRWLLELNARISVVRLALNSDSDIIVTTDVAGRQKVIYENFELAVHALSYYTDAVYPLLMCVIADGLPANAEASHDGGDQLRRE